MRQQNCAMDQWLALEMLFPFVERLASASSTALPQEVEIFGMELDVGTERMANVTAPELLRVAETVERHLVDGLAHHQRVLGMLRNLLRPCFDRSFEFILWNRTVDQSKLGRSRSIELLGEQQQLAGLFRSIHEDLRVQLPGVASQTQSLFGMTELRRIRSDGQIHQLDQVHPRTDAMAMHLGNDRLDRVLECHIVRGQFSVAL